MESVSVVSPELWVGALQGRVPRRLWLFDAAISSEHKLRALVEVTDAMRQRTHSDAPSLTGCAGTNFLILAGNSVNQPIFVM